MRLYVATNWMTWEKMMFCGMLIAAVAPSFKHYRMGFPSHPEIRALGVVCVARVPSVARLHTRPRTAPGQSSPKRPQAEEGMSTIGKQTIHVSLAHQRAHEWCGWCSYAQKALASFGADGGNSRADSA